MEHYKKWCTHVSRQGHNGSSFPVKAEFQSVIKCPLLKRSLYTLINCPTGLGGDETWIPGHRQRQEQYVSLCFPACGTFTPCKCFWVSHRAKVISSHQHHLQGREKKIGLFFLSPFCLKTMCPSQLKSFMYGLIGEFRSSQMSATLVGGCAIWAKLTFATFFFFSHKLHNHANQFWRHFCCNYIFVSGSLTCLRIRKTGPGPGITRFTSQSLTRRQRQPVKQCSMTFFSLYGRKECWWNACLDLCALIKQL